ncbi:hypothetical protein OFM39_35925, partial [Escherichia coli]|nr:hypothetical protein [Escherichia coli]
LTVFLFVFALHVSHVVEKTLQSAFYSRDVCIFFVYLLFSLMADASPWRLALSKLHMQILRDSY